MKDYNIIDFINNRFKSDKTWMNGNCYWFAFILCSQFDNLNMFYNPVIGHFVAMDKINNKYYDFDGEHIVYSNDKFIDFNELKNTDILLYNRLIRDCRN